MNYSKEEILFLSHFFDWKNVLASVKELEILSRFTFGQQNFIKKAEVLTSKSRTLLKLTLPKMKILVIFFDDCFDSEIEKDIKFFYVFKVIWSWTTNFKIQSHLVSTREPQKSQKMGFLWLMQIQAENLLTV